jgi:DNA-directed RNA polymerase specialized sigma24 family protein
VIAKRLGISVSKVKTSLHRTREELRRVLEEEEIPL